MTVDEQVSDGLVHNALQHGVGSDTRRFGLEEVTVQIETTLKGRVSFPRCWLEGKQTPEQWAESVIRALPKEWPVYLGRLLTIDDVAFDLKDVSPAPAEWGEECPSYVGALMRDVIAKVADQDLPDAFEVDDLGGGRVCWRMKGSEQEISFKTVSDAGGEDFKAKIQWGPSAWIQWYNRARKYFDKDADAS